MASSTVKAVLISTGIAAVALFLKASVPIVVDFFVSRFPILWNSFLLWLTPPYLFVVINVIIFTIVASSRYYSSFGDHDREEDEILHGGDNKIQTEQIVEVKDVDLDASYDFVATFSPSILVTEVERSEEKQSVVVEEKIAGLINGGDDKFMELRSKLDQVPSMMEKSENLPPIAKHLVSTRSSHRKPVKASPKGVKRKKVLRVVKPKRHETSFENTWKMITEENKSTPLTSHYRRSDTLKLDAGEIRPALRKSETFRDVTNYQRSPTVTPPVKTKKVMSPSREELNRRVEAFIRKCKEERLESLRLDKEVVVA